MTEHFIETGRLILRRFIKDDWQDLYEYLSDKDVLRYEPYDVFTAGECRSEAARRSGDDDFWAVCLKETGKLIGNVYFAEREFGAWELGYVFNAAFHGNGYATEAARAIMGAALDAGKARRVIAMCDPLNEPSWRLLERLGMRREGHLVKNVFFKRDDCGNPIWKDTYEYGVLAAEWQDSHKTNN